MSQRTSLRSDLQAAVRKAIREAEDSYRRALALQARGMAATSEWREFARALSIVLAGNGSARQAAWLKKIGYPVEDKAGVREGIRRVARAAADGVGDLGQWSPMADAIAQHEQEAALREMEGRSPDFKALVRGSLPGADTPFTAAGVTERQRVALSNLVTDVMLGRPSKSVVGREIDSIGLGDFITKAKVELGVRLTDARLETVLRTSVATAETQAENALMQRPAVRLFAPLMEWRSAKTHTTRETHRLMDGYVGPVEAFANQRLGPPAGFNCLCSRVPMSLARCIARGLTDAAGIPDFAAIEAANGARQSLIDSGLFPDPGFNA